MSGGPRNPYKVTSGERITLPPIVRDNLGLRPGDRVKVTVKNGAMHFAKDKSKKSVGRSK